MKKNKISNEIMTRFYKGKASGEEIKMVLMAAENDPYLREEIEIMSSIYDQLADIRIKKDEKMVSVPDDDLANIINTIISTTTKVKVIPIQPSYVPMMLKAAQNKDLKAASDCVVQCEYEILKNYQSDVSFDTLIKLSSDNNWLQDGGTPLYNIGRILENYKLSIVRRYDCDLDTISQELQGGCQVIVAVNAEKLYGKNDEGQIPNHAVVVKCIDKNTITLFDPQNQREDSYEADQFLTAWKDSQFYMVSVAERGLREYEPQPIDVSDFPLEGELKDLIDAIAENTHEIWAKDRKKEGIEYGPVRDEKHNPDMVPYSDLPETEKDYDRKAALGILELVQRLGYKIEKK